MVSSTFVWGRVCAVRTEGASLGHALKTYLFLVKPLDTMTYTLAIFGVLLVTLIGGAVPAGRAARIDPLKRSELFDLLTGAASQLSRSEADCGLNSVSSSRLSQKTRQMARRVHIRQD